MNSYLNNFNTSNNNNNNNIFGPNNFNSNGFNYNTFSKVFPFMNNNSQNPDYSVMNTIPLLNNNQYSSNDLFNIQESTPSYDGSNVTPNNNNKTIHY